MHQPLQAIQRRGMTHDQVVEFLIEALHDEPDAQRVLGAQLVQMYPDLPASQLIAAFHAAARAIERMFAHEGRPPQQATQARALAAAIARDADTLGLDDPDVAALGTLWAAGTGALPLD